MTFKHSAAAIVILSAAALTISAEDKPKAEALKYSTEKTADLGVGLWAYPVPVDYDGDGLKDLIVGCPDTPYHGTYLFRNIGTRKKAFFEKAVKISDKASHHLFSAEINGKTIVTDYDAVIDLQSDNRDTIIFSGEEFRKESSRSRNCQWAACDWDNDGDTDYIVGYDSWADYGWDNAFDSEGNWTRGPLHGNIYLILNENGSLINKGKIEADGKAIDVYGTVSPCIADFDRDGDLDIICGEFVDGFTWFENTGSRENPLFAAGRQLRNRKGDIRIHLEMVEPRCTDWDGDGKVDLIAGDEDGRVAIIRNTGRVRKGMPVFKNPVYFRQKADDVKFGALSTPCSYDWDGDGEDDIIAGNSSGEIAFIRNLGGGESWAEPENLTIKGKPLRIMAGLNGSIQGPAERKWGYSVLSVADWDGDGRADIIVNSISGKIEWYKGLGGLRLAQARPVKVAWEGATPKVAWNWWTPEEGTLSTQWRTTPVALDWNKDGLCDLIVMDREGYPCYFERRPDGLLKAGQRIFRCTNGCLYRSGAGIIDSTPGILRLNDLTAGASGRRKICFTDWDNDGNPDLIVDSQCVCWFRGLGTEEGEYLLEFKGEISSSRLAGHTTCPTPTDWNKDGISDLLVGAEDGRFYLISK